mmetsp:Transcript_37246/g.93532  ORF Transcript_37246/g.93532 Transcript_37246/m.93532 type:complete len:155 (+) Transcript_37246:221-685(+)
MNAVQQQLADLSTIRTLDRLVTELESLRALLEQLRSERVAMDTLGDADLSEEEVAEEEEEEEKLVAGERTDGDSDDDPMSGFRVLVTQLETRQRTRRRKRGRRANATAKTLSELSSSDSSDDVDHLETRQFDLSKTRGSKQHTPHIVSWFSSNS